MSKFLVSFLFLLFIVSFLLLAVFEGPGFLPIEKTSFSGISATEEGSVSELGNLSLYGVYLKTWTGKASKRNVEIKNSNLSNVRVILDPNLPGVDDVVAVTLWPALSDMLLDPGKKNHTTTSITAKNLVIWVKNKKQRDAWENWLGSVKRLQEFLRPKLELREVSPKKLLTNY